MNTRTLICKVAGVTYDGRQSILAQLTGNEPCRVVPEPTNPYDANALAVHVAVNGKVEHVGYVPRGLASEVAPHLEGEAVMVRIQEITGGFEKWDGEIASLGLQIVIEIPDNEPSSGPEYPEDYDLPHGDFDGE
jgi:hypothetical protein